MDYLSKTKWKRFENEIMALLERDIEEAGHGSSKGWMVKSVTTNGVFEFIHWRGSRSYIPDDELYERITGEPPIREKVDLATIRKKVRKSVRRRNRRMWRP